MLLPADSSVTPKARRPYVAPQIVYDAEMTACAGSPLKNVTSNEDDWSDPAQLFKKKY